MYSAFRVQSLLSLGSCGRWAAEVGLRGPHPLLQGGEARFGGRGSLMKGDLLYPEGLR